jgi:hypothetical protein
LTGLGRKVELLGMTSTHSEAFSMRVVLFGGRRGGKEWQVPGPFDIPDHLTEYTHEEEIRWHPLISKLKAAAEEALLEVLESSASRAAANEMPLDPSSPFFRGSRGR